jgi:methylsterol monooxygenase
MDPHPARIIIYACVTDIDGCPQRRHAKIGEDFCATILNRGFNPTLHQAGYDHVHIPANFDSQQPLKRWFILDLDVVQTLSQEDVLQLPHEIYLASQQNGKL